MASGSNSLWDVSSALCKENIFTEADLVKRCLFRRYQAADNSRASVTPMGDEYLILLYRGRPFLCGKARDGSGVLSGAALAGEVAASFLRRLFPCFPVRASETALPPQFRVQFRARFPGVPFPARFFLSVLPSQPFDVALGTVFRLGLSGATLPARWFGHGFSCSFGSLPRISFLPETWSESRDRKRTGPFKGRACA